MQREQQHAVDVLAGEVVVEVPAPLRAWASSSTSWRLASVSAALIPRITPAKNGSPKIRSSDSAITSATASVRWVTSARAAGLGT